MTHNASKDEFRAADGDAVALLDRLPPEQLARLVAPYAVRDRRLARRDALIREVAGELYGHKQHGFSGALSAALKEFSARGFDRDAAFDTPQQSRLRSILDANNGKPLGKVAIQNVLNGNRTPPFNESLRKFVAGSARTPGMRKISELLASFSAAPDPI